MWESGWFVAEGERIGRVKARDRKSARHTNAVAPEGGRARSPKNRVTKALKKWPGFAKLMSGKRNKKAEHES